MSKKVKMNYSKLYKELERQEQYTYDEIQKFYEKEFKQVQEKMEKVEESLKEKSTNYLKKWVESSRSVNLNDKSECLNVYGDYLKEIKEQPGSQIRFNHFRDELEEKI